MMLVAMRRLSQGVADGIGTTRTTLGVATKEEGGGIQAGLAKEISDCNRGLGPARHRHLTIRVGAAKTSVGLSSHQYQAEM